MKDKVLVTPVGTAIYPRLNTPDTAFDSDGVYNVSLGLTKDEAVLLEGEIKKVADEFAEGKPIDMSQVKLTEDKDSGLFLLKAKTKAKFKNPEGKMEDRKLQIFNKFNEPVTDFVRHGAKIALRLKLVPFKGRTGVGVSRLITHVLLIENPERKEEEKQGLFGSLTEKKKVLELNADL